MSLLGLLTGQIAQAAGPQRVREHRPAPNVQDVALQAAGTLQGQLFDAQGTPVAHAELLLRRGSEVVASARSDSRGVFRIPELAGGVYELQTPTSRGIYRLWAPNTAPPSAQEGVLVVGSEDILRGQPGRQPWLNGIGGALANPWVLALIVGAAIAIPLAIDSDDDDAS